MSKKETADILIQEKAKTPETHTLYAINAIRPAILQRAITGNKRALRLRDAEDEGVREEEYKEWLNTVENLYEASKDFYEALGTEAEAEAEAEVALRWKLCVQCGENDVLTPNMYIRPTDVHNCRVWATEIDTKKVRGIGTVGVYTGKDKFRGIIETRIALRIAGNATLKDDDRDTIDTYEKACKAVDNAQKVINGYTEGKTVVASIDAQITDAQNVLAQIEDALKAAGVENVEAITGRQKAVVESLKEQKKKAEDKLKKWSKVKADTQPKYEAIVAKLDAIENVTDDVTPVAETVEEQKERLEDARAKAKEKAAAAK